MILNQKLVDALNKQVSGEMISYLKYNSMANWFAEKNLNGWEKLFREYAIEEIDHLHRLQKHINDNQGHCNFPATLDVKTVKTTWSGIDEILKDALQHEMNVSMIYHGLKKLAISIDDFTTSTALDYFLNEQVSEENKIRDLIAQFESGTANTVVTLMDQALKHSD